MFPSWWKDESLLVVIDIGIDESGAKNLLVVSALAGQTARMKKMSKAWTASLERVGVDYFHAKEHWNRRSKAYHGISVTKRRWLLQQCVKHIHKYSMAGFSVAIDSKEFDRITDQRFKTEWGSSYSFAIQLMFIMIHFYLRKRSALQEPVNILIEDGHKNSKQIIEIIQNGKRKKGGFIKIGAYGLGGKIGNPILQAADLLAYGSCQALATGGLETQGDQRVLSQGDSKAFARLIADSPIPFIVSPWSPSVIEAIKEDLDAYLAGGTQKIRDMVRW
jgi:hypothetical protein